MATLVIRKGTEIKEVLPNATFDNTNADMVKINHPEGGISGISSGVDVLELTVLAYNSLSDCYDIDRDTGIQTLKQTVIDEVNTEIANGNYTTLQAAS